MNTFLILERVGTRGRIVLLAVGAALPMITFTAYLLIAERLRPALWLPYCIAALSVVVLTILVASYGAERLVLGPIRAMLGTTRRVSAGDLRARTGISRGREELSQLAAELDAMAEHLQRRDSELQTLLTQLRQQALTDPLTGLYNRRFFWDALARQFAESRRDQAPFSVIMLDIDHFKRVNDTWGHDAGDYVLLELGSAIRRFIRESDVAARYGGEEFAILMPDTTLAVAADRAEQLRRDVKQLRMTYDRHAVAVTISLGVAEAGGILEDPVSLMKAVDAAMYRAKANGRDRVEVASAQTREKPFHSA